MFAIFNELRNKLVKWCTGEYEITIGDLHSTLHPTSCNIVDDTGAKKFIEQSTPIGYFVKGPGGFKPIKHSMKTVKYDTYKLRLETTFIECADQHLVQMESGELKRVVDINPGEFVNTITGPQKVLEVVNQHRQENMYDLHVDSEDHLYFTNGIVSHNSTIAVVYLLWLAIFHPDQTILIASNKNAGAMEMIKRMQLAYEFLPLWLKPGVSPENWNKHSIGFDNNSIVHSVATSPDSGRGMSISTLYLDEFAFVPASVQGDFWASITPTLSTGGSCIITSTPNGSKNLFAKIWRGAVAGNEAEDGMGFYPVRVDWDEVPGRDEKFLAQQIDILGELLVRQEFLCEFLSSNALLIDSIELNTLKKEHERPPIHELKKVRFWSKIEEGEQYIIGVDPATGSGKDFTVIQVVHFPSLDQVAEFRSNTATSPEAYKILKGILRLLERAGAMAYFSIENNGVGEGMLSLYLADESAPEFAELINGKQSKRGDTSERMGMNTNGKNKIKACLKFKELVTSQSMIIHSDVVYDELESFVKVGTRIEADTGATDDAICAYLIVTRIVEQIASYDEDVYNKMYKVDEIDLEGPDDLFEGEYTDDFDSFEDDFPFIIN